MGFLHPNAPLPVLLEPDGVHFTMQQPLPFRWRGRLFRTPGGFRSDGMSGGGFVKAVFQDTNTFYCTIPHDGAYQDVLEESLDDGVTWNPVTLSKEESDAMLYELCIDNGTPPDKAKKIYEGVKLFGRAAFDADRAAIWGMAKPTKGK